MGARATCFVPSRAKRLVDTNDTHNQGAENVNTMPPLNMGYWVLSSSLIKDPSQVEMDTQIAGRASHQVFKNVPPPGSLSKGQSQAYQTTLTKGSFTPFQSSPALGLQVDKWALINCEIASLLEVGEWAQSDLLFRRVVNSA